MYVCDNQPLKKAKDRYLKLRAKAEQWPYVVYFSTPKGGWPKRRSYKKEKNAIGKAAMFRMTGCEVRLRVYNKETETWSDWNDR